MARRGGGGLLRGGVLPRCLAWGEGRGYVRARGGRRWFAGRLIQASPTSTILVILCGPAFVLNFVLAVLYGCLSLSCSPRFVDIVAPFQ
jgi:hypothetical protein